MRVEGTSANRMNETRKIPERNHMEPDQDYIGITFDVSRKELRDLSTIRVEMQQYLKSENCSKDVVEYGVLILHELCANATIKSEYVVIFLVPVEAGIFLAVRDKAGDAHEVERRLNAQQHMDNDNATRGRGLPMVAAMCENFRAIRDGEVIYGVCGVERLSDGGKQVWAYLPKDATLVV